jgi:uncharacterized FlaG/YvyC family protein
MSQNSESIREEILRLSDERMSRWRSIKDFNLASYEEAERVGKIINELNKKIASLNKQLKLAQDSESKAN